MQSLQRPGAATQAVGKGANAKAGDAESAENDAKGAYGASSHHALCDTSCFQQTLKVTATVTATHKKELQSTSKALQLSLLCQLCCLFFVDSLLLRSRGRSGSSYRMSLSRP